MQKRGRPRRPRALQACEVCRSRKNRCSEDRPCTYCIEHDLECTYARIYRDKGPKPRSNSHSQQLTQASMSDTIDFWPASDQAANLDERPILPSLQLPEPPSNTAGHSQKQAAANSAIPAREQTREQCSNSPSTTAPRNTASDVMDTNSHTRNSEFYGSASSVAFLRHVETLSNSQATTGPPVGSPERPVAELLYNADFQPDTSRSLPGTSRDATEVNTDRFYFRVARRFLDAYFSNIHYIQPIFEEDLFLTRCEDLWFNRPGRQPMSFIALYYATLSLGSLVMVFENQEISGADRFTWSRKLFNHALARVTQLGTATDMETVQCFYMIGKICQHELNPHVAYLYSGQAARIALAIGLNRMPVRAAAADPGASAEASNTWWAVYCLDIQTSFALGRPDSLGPDPYHTQYLPTETPGAVVANPQNPHVLQIVPCMVSLSRIMRQVALTLYTQSCALDEQLRRANELDAELQHWLARVPAHLRSEQQGDADLCLKPIRLASYIKKQSVVLRLRYLNVRMVAHALFMIDDQTAGPDLASLLHECQSRCIQAAEDSIDLIYSTFRADNYFQTWWYNATYTLFAVSILLAVVFRQLARTQEGLAAVFAHIDRAIVILRAMDDCLVAKNAIGIILRTLARSRNVHQPALSTLDAGVAGYTDVGGGGLLQSPSNKGPQLECGHGDAGLQSPATTGVDLGTVDDMDWLSFNALDDSQQSLFWTKWAHEIDSLGT